ncbi:MAG: glycoside hydrolase family 16 protein [Phocaeicola sp.]
MSKLTTAFFTILCGIFSSCSSNSESPDYSMPPLNPGEVLLFQDDFDTFDSSVWKKEIHEPGWTNQELQSYDAAHVTVGKDGGRTVLMLTAERKGGKIMSGRVNSKGKKSFKYGKIEANIKLPVTANGLWPAFWMMGDNNKEWPACGEIDIMEMGDADGIKNGNSLKRVNTALHFGPNVSGHDQNYFAGNAKVNLQDGNYHLYTMVWSEETIQVSIDGTLFNTFTIKDNPYFHDNFFILFNLAVGGSFTGITEMSKITALKEGEKACMYIDWVRIVDLK